MRPVVVAMLLALVTACDSQVAAPVPAADSSASVPSAATAHATASSPPWPFPPAPSERDIPPPAPSANLDAEVCRSLNTTCLGPQTGPCARLSDPRTVGWSHLLKNSQVINCVIAAQGLTSRDARAAWIRGCGTVIDCR